MKFEIGDKIQRIDGQHKHMMPGRIDIIESIGTEFSMNSLNLQKYGRGHDPSMFIIIEKSNKKTNKPDWF